MDKIDYGLCAITGSLAFVPIKETFQNSGECKECYCDNSEKSTVYF